MHGHGQVEAVTAELPICWRSRLLSRLGLGVAALGLLGVPVVMVAMLAAGPLEPEAIGWTFAIVVLTLPGVVAFILAAVRPRVCAGTSALKVRNLVATHHVPWEEVLQAEPGYYGIIIRRRTEADVVAVAVQKSNMASWLGRRTRADLVAERIMDIARNQKP